MYKVFTILKISLLFLYPIFFLSWSETWAISFSMLPNLPTLLYFSAKKEKSFTFLTLRGYIWSFPLPFSHFLNKSNCAKRYLEMKEEGGVIRKSYYINYVATGIDIHTFIFCFLGLCFVLFLIAMDQLHQKIFSGNWMLCRCLFSIFTGPNQNLPTI